MTLFNRIKLHLIRKLIPKGFHIFVCPSERADVLKSIIATAEIVDALGKMGPSWMRELQKHHETEGGENIH